MGRRSQPGLFQPGGSFHGGTFLEGASSEESPTEVIDPEGASFGDDLFQGKRSPAGVTVL